MTFDPRAIPNRAHYDRLMTWATSVFGRQDGETLAELQQYVSKRAADLAQDRNADDDERVRAVLAEIGFCAVIDHMASIIEDAGGGQ